MSDSPLLATLQDARRRRPARVLHDACVAVRTITLRAWLWATALGILALGAYLVGISQRAFVAWNAHQLVAACLHGMLGAYVLLIAVSIAEHLTPYDHDRRWRYWIAGASAVIIMVVVETSVAIWFPSTIGASGPPGIERRIGVTVFSLMNWSLCGGLAIAVYLRLQSVRRVRAAIRAADLARAEASRGVLAARLAAMQAQVEPRFLLGTLGQVEALYERDIASGAGMLKGLIAYLRAALPQLRGGPSTLAREAQLAEKYLDLVRLRLGSRLEYAVNVPPDLGDHEMPPMILLPLIESALRSGLEPMPCGGRIDVNVRAQGDRLKVSVADSGMAPRGIDDSWELITLRERLEALYGTRAQLTIVADAARSVTSVIELPLEPQGPHR